ncbi:MAG TPA: sn-glycerol-1-phosphate dehydrogenase [Lacipirellula sp.]
MSHAAATAEADLLAAALRAARDTRLLELERGACRRTGAAFGSLFGSATAQVIADENTFAVAGQDAVDSLRSSGQPCVDPVVLPAKGLYAEYSFVERIRAYIAATDAIPIAVGSGAMNDLVKLASHQCDRPYLAVATAASMDGYTAYGASITYQGSKQTFDCPAPRGVIADLDVIATAPPWMNASGYADLAAKCPAGADWIIADALNEEPIKPDVWNTVQSRLREWMAEPAGIRRGDFETLRRTTIALMMSGFAMQAALSSRPASGAEHQFSHLWDMEHHTHDGEAPSHGFKVGVGSLASLALYEALDEIDLSKLNIEQALENWPTAQQNEAEIQSLFALEELTAKAREQSSIKHISRDVLKSQLEQVKRNWPRLQQRLHEQLIPRNEFRDMLREAGAPHESEQIGISRDRLRRSYRQAYHIRRRFTVLDLARRTGLLEPALDLIFQQPGGERA